MFTASPDPTQFNLIRELAAKPHLSQRALAALLGMSVGKVNYCLRALIAKGLLKAQNYRNSENKLAYFYILTPSGLRLKAELTRYFLSSKTREYEELRLEIEQLRAESDAAAFAADVGSEPSHPSS